MQPLQLCRAGAGATQAALRRLGAAIAERPVWSGVLLASAVISFIGPRYFYGYDQDRDFLRVQRLLGGDWSVVIDGHQQFRGYLTTFGGIFYLIMAPFGWVSHDIRWLYFVIDVLAFLSIVPARRVFQVFFGRVGVDVLSAIWVANTARIICADAGWHPALTQSSLALWQLVELRFLLAPSARRGLAVVAVALLNLSLHLATVPALVALPLLWFAYHAMPRSRWLARAAELGAIALSFAFLSVLLRSSHGWSTISAHLRSMDSFLDTLLGFETQPDYMAGGTVYRGPFGAAVRGACGLVVLAGAAAVCLGGPIADRNQRLFRSFCVVHCLLFFAVYASAVPLIDPSTVGHRVSAPPSRYANTFYLTGVVLLFAASRAPVARLRLRPSIAVGVCYVFAGLHLANTALYRLRGRSALVDVGPPHDFAVPDDAQYKVIVRAIRNWNPPTGWLLGSVRVAPDVPTATFLPYYMDWLDHRYGRGGSRPGLRPDTRLLLVRPGSPEEPAARASALDVIDAGSLRAYLTPYTADTAGYDPLFCAGENSEFGVGDGFVYAKRDSMGRVTGYVASRIRPPAEAFAEATYEVVVDGGDAVKVATFIEMPVDGQNLRISSDDDRLLGSRLLFLGADGAELASLKYPAVVRGEPPDQYAGRAVLRARLDGFALADVADIQIELEYHDPSHYPEPRMFRWSVLNARRWSPGPPPIAWHKEDMVGRRREDLARVRRRLGWLGFKH